MTDIQDAASATHPLLDRVFTATAITENGVPRPLVAGTSIRLTFRDGHLGAGGGCNTFDFPMQIEAGQLLVGRGISTLIGCDADRTAQDQWLVGFLGDDPAWELCEPGLVLTGGGIRMELAEAPAPVLWDTTFVSLRVTEIGIVPAPVVEGTVITLTFTAPDQLGAQAGCNTFHCRVTDAGDHLEIDDDVASTRMACEPELQAQDRWLVELLTADPAYRLTSGGLTLTRGGTTVVLGVRPQ